MQVRRCGPIHLAGATCRQLTALRRTREKREQMLQARQLWVSAGGAENQLQAVDEYVYLGRTVNARDVDEPALTRNLLKARRRWGFLRRLLQREGASSTVSGYFYKAACQSALLYGSETWTWNSRMVATLESFHHHVAWGITRRFVQQSTRDDGTTYWTYPSNVVSLDLAGQTHRRIHTSMTQPNPTFRYNRQPILPDRFDSKAHHSELLVGAKQLLQQNTC
jgi:hypothetical protein